MQFRVRFLQRLCGYFSGITIVHKPGNEIRLLITEMFNDFLLVFFKISRISTLTVVIVITVIIIVKLGNNLKCYRFALDYLRW